MRSTHLIVLSSLLALAACKDPPRLVPVPPDAPAAPVVEPVPTPTPPTPTDAPAAPSPTAAAPVAILPLLEGGTRFQFSLRESPGALALQTAQCAQKAAGDGAKQAACLAEVEKEAVTEGIRFEQEGTTRLWVSYGMGADGKEEIYLRGPIQVIASPAHELRFRPAGPFTGKQAAEAQLDKLPAERFLTVRSIDAHTVAMDAPPPKGTLVYHSAAAH